MKVDVYSIMRNEARMLPYFLRHYETFADRIFVWDEDSDDGSREMLERHPKVILLPFPDDYPGGVEDTYWVERLWPKYKVFSRGQADWVMCVDVDEFLYCENMGLFLEVCKERGAGVVVCRGYLMTAEAFPATGGQIYEEVTRGLRDSMNDKWCLFRPEVDIEFRRGRHRRPRSIQPEDTVVERYGVKLLHFRNLGIDYMRERLEMTLPGHNKARRALGFPEIGMDYYDQPHVLPNTNRTRGNIWEWWKQNKDKAERVL
jgi:hypothetical protein